MITGELIQSLCDVYCGIEADFSIYNRERGTKNVYLDQIVGEWNNPRLLYCYGDRISLFIEKSKFIQNPFVLITHNSDVNMTEAYAGLLAHPKLLFWHAQNVLYRHPKLGGLPIGMANRTWPHGNLAIMDEVRSRSIQKAKGVYFFFAIRTNPRERQPCYEALVKKGLIFGTQQDFRSYLETMASHKYAICPPGNGVDCHRLWECYYLGVVPIVKRSVFTEKVASIFPCILVDDWNELNVPELLATYEGFPYSNKWDLDYVRQCIANHVDYFDLFASTRKRHYACSKS